MSRSDTVAAGSTGGGTAPADGAGRGGSWYRLSWIVWIISSPKP
jgi:hypothetical protein